MFKPMLAAEAILGHIHYPKIALPKLNGVRGINQDGKLMARSLKPIENLFTRSLFSKESMTNFDGELVVGDFRDEEVFVKSTSGIGSINGEPDVRWYLFDMFHPNVEYEDRLEILAETVARKARHPCIEMIPYRRVRSDQELLKYSDMVLSQGYEGLVLRDPRAVYKQGRSTAKEGGFLRFCPWKTSEAVILEILEGEVNNNVSKLNELGFLHKSSHKANKVGSGMAGSFLAKDLKTEIEFKMPVPTVKMQQDAWRNPNKYLQRIAHYKFKPAVKIGGKPRFSQLVGWRESWDMS